MTVNTLKLKARMVELGLKQKDVASELKCNPATYNRKLNDTTGKSLTTSDAHKLIRILKISNPNDYFFTSEGCVNATEVS